MTKIKTDFLSFLKQVDDKKDRNFSGLGLIVYNSKSISKLKHMSLRKTARMPKDMNIGNSKTVDFLINVASYKNPLHDGFHLINEGGDLTHLSQFVEIRLINGLKFESRRGARYASALLKSFDKGIIITGIVGKDYKPIFFQNGREIKIS